MSSLSRYREEGKVKQRVVANLGNVAMMNNMVRTFRKGEVVTKSLLCIKK